MNETNTWPMGGAWRRLESTEGRPALANITSMAVSSAGWAKNTRDRQNGWWVTAACHIVGRQAINCQTVGMKREEKATT